MIERLEKSSQTALISMQSNQQRFQLTAECIDSSNEAVSHSFNEIQNIAHTIEETCKITDEQVSMIEQMNKRTEALKKISSNTLDSIDNANAQCSNLEGSAQSLHQRIQKLNC